MCQLLGMNCADKTDFSFSLRGFCRRGGCTDIHSHGFGVSIYEGKGLRTFLDSSPAAESPIAELVAHYPIKTYNMMAHIRYATQGDVLLENVHPFSREMVRSFPCCTFCCLAYLLVFVSLNSLILSPSPTITIVGNSLVLLSQWRCSKVCQDGIQRVSHVGKDKRTMLSSSR